MFESADAVVVQSCKSGQALLVTRRQVWKLPTVALDPDTTYTKVWDAVFVRLWETASDALLPRS